MFEKKTLKFASAIYWPLDVESLDKSEETEKMLGFFGIVLLLLLLLWISLVVVGLERYSRVIYQSLFTKIWSRCNKIIFTLANKVEFSIKCPILNWKQPYF